MRKAILDGLVPEFSSSPFAAATNPSTFGLNKMSMNNMNNVLLNQNKMNMMMNGRPGGLNLVPGQGMMSRGGQLVVAGSVVGQWGANFGGGRGGGGGMSRGGGRGVGQRFGGK